MRGVAIFDTGLTGLQHSNGAEGLTLTNNWFGLKLDGTVDGNDVGVYLAGPNADVGVTGQPANVFAGNRLGLQMVGSDANEHQRPEQPLRRQARREHGRREHGHRHRHLRQQVRTRRRAT